MRRRDVHMDSKALIIILLVVLARTAAGVQDGVHSSNKQQVQQTQQGQNSKDKSDFLFIPALIALAAMQRQYREQQAQLAPSYTPTYPTTTTTTTTTVAQQQASSRGTSRPAIPAGNVLDLSTGATSAPAGTLAGSSAHPSGAATGSKASSYSSSSSSSNLQASGQYQGTGQPANPAGTVLDLTTGVKAAPRGTPAATGSHGTAATPAALAPAPAATAGGVPGGFAAAPAVGGAMRPAKPPAYSVSPGAPGDPPGTVLIMVPGTQAAAGPPASTVSAMTPGSSSSSSSSGNGSAGNSLTMIQVTTTAPPGDTSSTSDSSNVSGDANSGSGVTGIGESDGQSNTSGDYTEPVVSETPSGDQQQDSTTLQPATPAPAPAYTSTTPGVPQVTGAAAAPAPFVLRQAGATRTILIGCALPFEGNQRVVGEAVFEAARMALQDKGPTLLPGVNINLTCINSKCVDIPTYNAVYDLAEQRAVAVLGEVCSGASVAAAGVANARKLPVISPAATTSSLSQPDFFFRVVPSDTFQGDAAAELMVNSGVRNIGLVYEDTLYGYGLGFSFIAAFTAHGGNVPVVVMFKKGAGDVADAIKQLQAGEASSQYPLDAVFIATGNVSYVADLLVAAQSASLGLPLFAGDSIANPELMQFIGSRPSAVDKLTVVAPYPGDPAFLQRFADFIKQSNADPLAAGSVYAARGYDAMTALMQAYAAAQTPKDSPAIIATLQRQNFTGVSGPIAFDRYGDLVATDKTYIYGKHTGGRNGGISVQNFIKIKNDGVRVGRTAAVAARAG